ncbi:MAG: hypothetical protein HC810_03695 [Acaryochloridaceae cyanobacterium RL_2_7]|nr:hypothetical protein [Acaryochloridaceae cyanobacterium RL_2_7]
MLSSSPEQTIVNNPFGLVTTKRVAYMSHKNWFRGGIREDIPLSQVVSIRYEIKRCIFLGLLLVTGGLQSLTDVVGLLPMALGGLLLWGSPQVNVVTAGGTSAAVTGWPWHRPDAEAFANALRCQLFTE